MIQSVANFSEDVSTTVLNRLANNSHKYKMKKGITFIKAGEKDKQLFVVDGPVMIKVGKKEKRLSGPALVGECEYFLRSVTQKDSRLHSVTALDDIDALEFEADQILDVPVIIDNLRRIIRKRRKTIYQGLVEIDQTL